MDYNRYLLHGSMRYMTPAKLCHEADYVALSCAPAWTGEFRKRGSSFVNARENMLRTIRFDKPDYIPMVFHINEACWYHYPAEAVKELMAEHTFLFPDFGGGPGRAELDYTVPERAGRPFTDAWGCVWETSMNGIVGTVTKHPLESWDSFDSFTAPNPQVDTGSKLC